MVNVEPWPRWLSTLMEPPMRSTTCLTIESPRPVPPKGEMMGREPKNPVA